MNRNMIVAIATSLMAGLWGGMVLARVGGGGAPAATGVDARIESLRAADAPRAGEGKAGMAFLRARFDTSGEQPKACLEFSRELSADPKVTYSDFIALEPAAAVDVTASGALLCLAGLGFEPDRQVTIRAGLPAKNGEVTDRDETFTLSFGDRPTFVGFAGGGVILPRSEADGLGIETVNVSALDVEVLRVSDRVLHSRALEVGQAIEEGSWDWWGYEDAGGDVGVKVYEGRIDVALKDPKTNLERRNATVTTVFPLGAALKKLEAGAYVVKVRDASPGAGARGRNNDRPAAAHRWILYTDMALQTFEGATGMDVVARSLQSAKPIAGVTLTLIAQNDDELARARTDGEGRVRFPAAALKGEGPARPRYVMAYGPGGDFTVLDMERPTLDVSDRNVAGRSAPGDVDVYMYTDRGIYRPGETVWVTGLLRDAAGRALGGRDSTLVLYRPNGTEARRMRLTKPGDIAAISKRIDIDRSAPRGRWRAALEVDGQDGAVGEVAFAVEDFVPQRLKVGVEASEAPMSLGEVRPVTVDAQFLYGAPGAGLTIEGEARVQVDPNPFPNEKGFAFGLTDAPFNERFVQLPSGVTDGAGVGTLQFALDSVEDTTLPLRARLVATALEPGGRAVREGFDIPVRLKARYLGLKAKSESGLIPEGGEAAFELVAVDAAGKRVDVRGVQWTLVEEDWNYDWYLEDGQWRWRRTGRDIPIAADVVQASAGAPVVISRAKMRYGQYRLIAKDDASGAATSMRFQVGWGGGAADQDTPDMVAVAPPVEAVKPGGQVRVRIKPPYAGEAQIVVATDRVLSMRTMKIGAEGATVTLRADEDWGAGAYVLVTVMTARDAASQPVPRRAVGVAYVPLDMGARTLSVAVADDLQAPVDASAKAKVVRPNQKLMVPVRITGARGGEKVFMTLAAVDEGILQLTKFASPDPTAHYFGQRALGVGVRDDYGRLLNPNLGAPAVARQGGDGLGGEGLTTVPTRTVALWSGVVTPDRQGRASVPLDLPGWDGRLRLMAVAWTATALGADAEPLIVRDPIVADLTLPRFLAPGDRAEATLNLVNAEGPAGAYAVSISGGAAAAMTPFNQSFSLQPKQQQRLRIPVSGGAAGLGRVTLTVKPPSGEPITRTFDIQSRSPFLPVTETQTVAFAPAATFRLGAEALAAFAPGEGRAVASFSALRGIDAGPLLDVLNRYPYGCSEQITSTTMPLLYANVLAASAQQSTDPRLRQRVQDTVNRLLDRQGADGAFGLWRAEDRAASPWLGAYVTDFLRRAKQAGYVVPAKPLDDAYKALRAVGRLEDFAAVSYDGDVYVWPGSNDTKELMSSRAAAYALYVLAKAGKADVGQLRYFHDAKLRADPSPLARAQIGAALAHLGDRARSRAAFRAAEDVLGYRNTGDYYQTPLRDLAGVLALAAEAGETELVDRLAKRLEKEGRDAEDLMTQEQAQLLMAADALLAKAGPLKVSLGGQPAAASTVADAARLAQGLVFRNDGAGQIFRTLTTSGPPRAAPAAASAGYGLDKRIFTLAGGGVGAISQGDRVVVVLSGAAQSPRLHPSMLVDMLPAGLEIESVLKPEDGASGGGPESANGPFAWIGRISSPRVAEARDDRFVAAIDLRGESFTLAYVARAVTPGDFTLPAAQIEDMYRPGVFARTSPARLTISPGG